MLDGNIYYNSLTVAGNDYYCDVYKMSPGSIDWDEGTYAQGGRKQWMTIDKSDSEGKRQYICIMDQRLQYLLSGFFYTFNR